ETCPLCIRHHPHPFICLIHFFFSLCTPRSSTFFPYTTLFRSSLSCNTNVRVPCRTPMLPAHSDAACSSVARPNPPAASLSAGSRSEEHTSELQSQSNIVCRLLLDKKKKRQNLFQELDAVIHML